MDIKGAVAWESEILITGPLVNKKVEGFNMKTKIFRSVFLVVVLSFFLCGAGMASGPSDPVKLPDTMLWSCYDVGSTGYVHASAMADALLKKYGVRVRLLPSGTGIGRITPVTTKRVSVGWLATEAFFATQGIFDFATYTWGPQDIRVILAHPQSHAVIVTKQDGIKKLSDLKGKRVCWIPGNDSLNIKMTAYLAFGGLTWDDVEKVEFPSYGASMKGIIAGKVDAVCGTVTAGLAYELASTPKGIYYPPFPLEDKAGWARMLKVCNFLTPYKEIKGADLSEDNPAQIVSYRYPIGTVTADADPDFVYNLVKALDETFPIYKDAHSTMPQWDIKEAGVPPCDAPFHEGAIKYLKEKGIWTAEHQAWNDKAIEEMNKLKEPWEKAKEEGLAQNMNDDKFKEYWMSVRAKVLDL